MLWRHNFCPWRQKYKFFTWLKFYCWCGHVARVWYLQHFYETNYCNLNFIRIWPGKTLFLRGGLGSSSIIWDLHYVRANFKLYLSVAKGLKLKVKKFWELIPTFVEVSGGKVVGGLFTHTTSWIGLMWMKWQ